MESKINFVPSNPSHVSDFSDEVIEMTKMEKIISSHMSESIKTSAHVQSFIEVYQLLFLDRQHIYSFM